MALLNGMFHTNRNVDHFEAQWQVEHFHNRTWPLHTDQGEVVLEKYQVSELYNKQEIDGSVRASDNPQEENRNNLLEHKQAELK